MIVLSEVTENFYIPVAFAYLPGKSEEIYTTLFTSIICILKELGFSLSANFIMCDFESGLRKSLQKCFPEITIKGCHFHYGQCIWRFVQSYGMKKVFAENSGFRSLIHATIGLAFVSLERIEEALKVLELMGHEIKEMEVKKFLKLFFGYLKSQWIYGNIPPGSWNYFLVQSSTTNNFNEGYNHKLR